MFETGPGGGNWERLRHIMGMWGDETGGAGLADTKVRATSRLLVLSACLAGGRGGGHGELCRHQCIRYKRISDPSNDGCVGLMDYEYTRGYEKVKEGFDEACPTRRGHRSINAVEGGG